jgi:adenylate cyclase
MSPVYPPWFLDVLAAAYRDSGDLESAILVARRAIEINAADVEARHVLCTALMRGQTAESATAVAREIGEIAPQVSLSTYAEAQPYKDEKHLHRLVEELHAAGVPA